MGSVTGNPAYCGHSADSARRGSGGAVGLAVIPCIVAHIEQILMDSLLVAKWLESDRAAKAKGI
jgi:hypothetical protein